MTEPGDYPLGEIREYTVPWVSGRGIPLAAITAITQHAREVLKKSEGASLWIEFTMAVATGPQIVNHERKVRWEVILPPPNETPMDYNPDGVTIKWVWDREAEVYRGGMLEL